MWKKHMSISAFYRYEHCEKARVSKRFRNKFRQSLWKVVIYLPKKNAEHGIEHGVLDSPYGVCIH